MNWSLIGYVALDRNRDGPRAGPIPYPSRDFPTITAVPPNREPAANLPPADPGRQTREHRHTAILRPSGARRLHWDRRRDRRCPTAGLKRLSIAQRLKWRAFC